MTGIDLGRARGRALRLYPRSKGFQNAYVRGARAALARQTAAACPYPVDPSGSWRQAWRIAWMRGHRSEWIPPEQR